MCISAAIFEYEDQEHYELLNYKTEEEQEEREPQTNWDRFYL